MEQFYLLIRKRVQNFYLFLHNWISHMTV